MFKLKNSAEIERLRVGGRRLAQIVSELAAVVRPGLTTAALDELARTKIKLASGRPAFLNYQPLGAKQPFPAALCVSVNDEVVHGIPGPRMLEDGDIVTLDLGLEYQGMFTDMAVTVAIGAADKKSAKLLAVTAEALRRGIAAAQPGRTLGDIGWAIESFVVKENKYGLVRVLGGHGVGFQVHEEPEVANYGRPGVGAKLVPGLVIAIEPMVTLGRDSVKVEADGYTVKTSDGSLAAHFEHTIVVTEHGPEILTII